MFAIHVTPEQDLREAKIMNLIGEAVDQAYLAKVKTVNIDLDLIKNVGANMKFVYSPLHGTGKVIARRALEEALRLRVSGQPLLILNFQLRHFQIQSFHKHLIWQLSWARRFQPMS